MPPISLELRDWQPGDEALALRLWGNAEVMRYVPGLLRDLEGAGRCIAAAMRAQEEHGVALWKVMEKGEFLGACGLHADGELAYHLLPEHQGRGIATRAALLALRRSGRRTIRAWTHPDNEGSVAVLKKLGACELEPEEGERSFVVPALIPAVPEEIEPLLSVCAPWFEQIGQPADVEALFRDRPPGPCRKEVLGIWERGLAGVVDLLHGYPDPRTWFIGLLVLSPDRRGQGLGVRVEQQLVTEARVSGVQRMRLGVQFNNTAGRRFWERCGYTVLGEAPLMEAEDPKPTVWLMEKELPVRSSGRVPGAGG